MLFRSSTVTLTSTGRYISQEHSFDIITNFIKEGDDGGYTYMRHGDYTDPAVATSREKVFYPSEDKPFIASSCYQAFGLERLPSNVWGLKPICYAAVARLYDKGFETFDGLYREPTKLSMGLYHTLVKDDFTGFDFTAVGASSTTRYWQDNPVIPGAGFSIGSFTPVLQSIPAGWTCWQYFMVIGENGADVRSKIKYLYDSGELDNLPTEADAPDVFKKRLGVAKSRDIY